MKPSDALVAHLRFTEVFNLTTGEGAKPDFGETYFVGADIVRLIASSLESFPERPFRTEDCPAATGFVFFEQPFILHDTWPELIQGIWWESSPRGVHGWEVKPETSDSGILGNGITLDTGLWHPRPATEDEPWRASVFLHALWLFIKEPIVARGVQRAQRAERRRLAAKGIPESPIRVVLLRAKHYEPRESEASATREYSCRWIVRGHWHQYWCGAGSQRHLEPRFVAAHVKGPDGLPLRRNIDVFAVTR